MKFKYNSKTFIEIFENQLKSGLYINGRPYLVNSKNIQLFIDLFSILNISINIITLNKKRKIFKLRKILFESIKLYKNEKFNIKNINHEKIKKINNNPLIIKKLLLFPIIIIIFISIIFFLDFQSIQTKINSENLSSINSLKSDYEINKCEINGNLSSLHSYCDNLKSQINILEKKTPTVLSTFFIWILDILNSIYAAMGIKNILITTFIIFIIKKFL
jgi:hypothetical protein